MHYIQISITIVLIMVFIVSLVHLLSLSIKVATNRLNRRDAMRSAFATSLSTWASIFIMVIIWMDKEGWTFEILIMVTILLFSLSIILAGISALAFWSWKKQ
jgi:hypothetical protein